MTQPRHTDNQLIAAVRRAARRFAHLPATAEMLMCAADALATRSADTEALYCENCGRRLTEAEAEQCLPVNGSMWCATCQKGA